MEVTPARIVMIDDQVSFVDAFGLALSLTEDLKLVGRATNAQDGTDLALQHRPDLVVTDYRLPNGQTGTAVADQLRSEGFQSPIIVLTGFLAPQVRREVAGLVDVCAISKDASVQDIVTSMRSVLSGEADPVTPPEYGERVVNMFESAAHIVNPGQGHMQLPLGCMPQVLAEFVRDLDAAAVSRDCLERLQPPSFFVDANGPLP